MILKILAYGIGVILALYFMFYTTFNFGINFSFGFQYLSPAILNQLNQDKKAPEGQQEVLWGVSR